MLMYREGRRADWRDTVGVIERTALIQMVRLWAWRGERPTTVSSFTVKDPHWRGDKTRI